MNWIILIFAGLMEVGFTFCLGKTKTATGQRSGVVVDRLSCRVGNEHVFNGEGSRKASDRNCLSGLTGIGAVGAVIVGIVFFHEPATFWRIFFITTLILSIIGLKVLG